MSEQQQFKLAGIMGMPVFQSRSPILHNHWIKQYGIRGAYGHFPVQIENVETAIRGLSALGLAGSTVRTRAFSMMMPAFMGVLQTIGRLVGCAYPPQT